jgi:hypothetical protein
MAMPSGLSAPPLVELGIGIDDIDPESLILFGLGTMFPGGYFNPEDFLGLNPNGYNFTSLKYPDDIEHFFMHGHYMNFFINVPVWSKYYGEGVTDPKTGQKISPDYFMSSVAPGAGSYTQNGVDYRRYNTTNLDYFGDEVTHAEGIGGAIQNIRNKRITQAISLYIPDSVSYSSAINYENTSAVGEGKKFMAELDTALHGIFSRGVAGKINQTIGGLVNATQIAGGALGFALNENLLVLFRSMGLRTFSYDFFFSPKSAREALAVRNIIKSFRFHAHPEVNFGYGLLYTAPGTFDITFMHRGTENKNIHKVSTCVLNSVEVDYAPLGWTTHTDGMPIQTRLSLSFTETEVMTKEKISSGY